MTFFEAFMDELTKVGGPFLHMEKRWPKDQDPDHNDMDAPSGVGSGPPVSWVKRRGKDTDYIRQKLRE